jgi:hypothetical protein
VTREVPPTCNPGVVVLIVDPPDEVGIADAKRVARFCAPNEVLKESHTALNHLFAVFVSYVRQDPTAGVVGLLLTD